MKILFIIFTSFFVTSFTLENNIGKYEYRRNNFIESIELLKNQKFNYERSEGFSNYKITGSYFVSGDSLILNSSPQKDKIIVREKNTGKFENKTFKVSDKKGNLIVFHLYLTLIDNSKIVIKDSFEKVKFKSAPIKSFHIVNTMGLKSPEYILEGKHTNFFEVQFENMRVFDNENWYLIENKIQPKGLDGENQKYYLTKK
ncbi:hypothetical protein [Flavobacterium difficile]|uniref:Uncharacterized protein n=1 Tax=Flavobacterium difficile TaxID=2709659 RepID=A0ABX0I6M1_9FLAO|nr:hypothetical protein [Flavobacterium difficile]NHM02829.1 hypothetical protein [Flavobacterium difficile]